MNEAIFPNLPFLLPAATALAVLTVAAFAVSLVAARLLFVRPLFTAVGAYLVRPSASAYDDPGGNAAYNSADPRSADSRNAAIGAVFVCFMAWFALAIACGTLLMDPDIPYVKDGSPSNAMRFVVCIAGLVILYTAHRLLFVLIARQLSPEDLAAVRAKLNAMQWRG